MVKKQKRTKISIGRTEFIISIIVLISSLIALWQSFKAQSENSSPNIQIISALISNADSRGNSVGFEFPEGNQLHKNFFTVGTITLKNFGITAVQLTDVSWEPLDPDYQSIKESSYIIGEVYFFICDCPFTTKEWAKIQSENSENDLDQRKTIIDIDRTIAGGEKLTLLFSFKTGADGLWIPEESLYYYERIIFVFNNGQVLSTVPE